MAKVQTDDTQGDQTVTLTVVDEASWRVDIVATAADEQVSRATLSFPSVAALGAFLDGLSDPGTAEGVTVAVDEAADDNRVSVVLDDGQAAAFAHLSDAGLADLIDAADNAISGETPAEPIGAPATFKSAAGVVSYVLPNNETARDVWPGGTRIQAGAADPNGGIYQVELLSGASPDHVEIDFAIGVTGVPDEDYIPSALPGDGSISGIMLRLTATTGVTHNVDRLQSGSWATIDDFPTLPGRASRLVMLVDTVQKLVKFYCVGVAGLTPLQEWRISGSPAGWQTIPGVSDGDFLQIRARDYRPSAATHAIAIGQAATAGTTSNPEATPRMTAPADEIDFIGWGTP
jgi:hypothetical protein